MCVHASGCDCTALLCSPPARAWLGLLKHSRSGQSFAPSARLHFNDPLLPRATPPSHRHTSPLLPHHLLHHLPHLLPHPRPSLARARNLGLPLVAGRPFKPEPVHHFVRALRTARPLLVDVRPGLLGRHVVQQRREQPPRLGELCRRPRGDTLSARAALCCCWCVCVSRCDELERSGTDHHSARSSHARC